jgi:hypothetical protein
VKPAWRSRRGRAAEVLFFLLCATSFGATTSVSTVSQLESALASAKANGQDDVINVAPGTYYLESTLTYHAPTNENRTLTIQCAGGGAVIDAGTIYIGTMRGMYITTTGTAAHVTLSGLTVQNGLISSPEMGAGLFIRTRWGNITLSNCVIRNNKATELFNSVNAAGAYLGVNSGNGSITVRDCFFSNNYAKGTGGGLYMMPAYGTTNALINNLFVTNSASTQGGGAYISLATGTLTLDNNTFTRNWTGVGSGGGGAYIRLFNDDCTVNLRNNILWGNTAENGIGGDVYVEDDGGGNSIGATVNVYCTDIGDLDIQDGDHLMQGGNTNADPLLTGDLHLRAASPCIDAGTNLAWMAGATDVDGQSRIFNDRADMGVDETAIAAVTFAIPGAVTSVWDAVVDAKCRLQYSTNLLSGEWKDAGNTATATSRRIALVDTNLADAARFYSLKWSRP